MIRALLPLSRAAIANPLPALALMTAVTLVGALGLLRLELRTDGHALVPRDDPVVRFDTALREDFGLRDPIVVYVETPHPDGIYNPTTLRHVRDLGEALAEIPGFSREWLTSLDTEKRPRVYTGTFRFRPLLDPWPETPEQLALVREDVDEIGILTGTLVSEDARAAAVVLGSPPSASLDPEGVDRRELHREIDRRVADLEDGSHRVLVVGAPIAEALLGAHILEDLTRLVPVAMAVVALVLWVACRRAAGVGLALWEVGSCLLFTFGVMGWSDVPVYLTTAVLPVILTAIGIADELHILLHYQRELEETPPGDATPPGAAGPLERTMAQMVRPVTITSLTTGLGFLSFLVAPIAPVSRFGLFAALGIAFCWLWSLVAVPAALAWLGPERMRRRPLLAAAGGGEVLRLLERGLAFPSVLLRIFAALTLVLGVGVLGLRVQDSWIDGFAPDSPFRRATEYVDHALHGTHVLLAEISFDPEARDWPPVWDGRRGPLLSPEVLGAIGALEADLREVPGVGGALGPHSHMETVNYLFLAGQPGSRRIPEDPRGVAIVLDRFDQARGARRRREVIHDDLHRGVVTVLVRNANYRDTAVLMDRARESAERHLAPLGGRLAFGGDLAVSQAMIPAIVRTQIGSLALALLGAFVAVTLLTRSRRTAGYAIAPTAVAVLWLLGAMGWRGVPVGVATSTFCAITLGIGVDYAVHLLERVRRAREAGAVDVPLRAVREAAPAILADAFAVSLGFGVLGLSQVPANARLGLVIAVALLAAVLLTLVGLPALLARAAQRGETPPV